MIDRPVTVEGDGSSVITKSMKDTGLIRFKVSAGSGSAQKSIELFASQEADFEAWRDALTSPEALASKSIAAQLQSVRLSRATNNFEPGL